MLRSEHAHGCDGLSCNSCSVTVDNVRKSTAEFFEEWDIRCELEEIRIWSVMSRQAIGMASFDQIQEDRVKSWRPSIDLGRVPGPIPRGDLRSYTLGSRVVMKLEQDGWLMIIKYWKLIFSSNSSTLEQLVMGAYAYWKLWRLVRDRSVQYSSVTLMYSSVTLIS